MPVFYVMIGGAVGAAARYLTGVAMLARFGPAFPYGTLSVNLIGSVLMGMLAGVLARTGASETMRLLLGVGVLGGFTTFSAFSLDAVVLIERGALGVALGYVLLSVIGSIVAVFAGLGLVRSLA